MALKPHNEGVIDPLNWEGKYKGLRLKGISTANVKVLRSFLDDFERGVNVGSHKGTRSYARLATLGCHLRKMAELFEKKTSKNLVELDEEDVTKVFNDLTTGKLARKDGKKYATSGDMVKNFRTFWYWHTRVQKKKGVMVPDICVDLYAEKRESNFVYLTFEELQKLSNAALAKYRALLWFLFDSGIRSPTELCNVKVSDLTDDKESSVIVLGIRDETSKTFGRKIKLMLCSSALRTYISEQKLKGDDFLFPWVHPALTNRYLKHLSSKVFGTGKSKGGEYYHKLTMYDLRHCSACHYRSLYKTYDALLYRYGWKSPKMLDHYSKLLGAKDNICEADMLGVNETLQVMRDLEIEKKSRMLADERMDGMRSEIDRLHEMLQNTMSVISYENAVDIEKGTWKEPTHLRDKLRKT